MTRFCTVRLNHSVLGPLQLDCEIYHRDRSATVLSGDRVGTPNVELTEAECRALTEDDEVAEAAAQAYETLLFEDDE